GAGQQAALRARMLRADLLVVRVEQLAESGVKGSVVRARSSQDEGLEEPARMGEVPLRGAGIVHRLHLAVLGRERRPQLLGERSHRAIAVSQVRGGGATVVAWARRKCHLPRSPLRGTV